MRQHFRAVVKILGLQHLTFCSVKGTTGEPVSHPHVVVGCSSAALESSVFLSPRAQQSCAHSSSLVGQQIVPSGCHKVSSAPGKGERSTLVVHPYTTHRIEGWAANSAIPGLATGLYRAHSPLFPLPGPTAVYNERAHPQQGQVSQDNKENKTHRDLSFVLLLLIFQASTITERSLWILRRNGNLALFPVLAFFCFGFTFFLRGGEGDRERNKILGVCSLLLSHFRNPD